MNGERAVPSDTGPAPGQRVDKWLWCARFFKTRSLAAKFIADGGVRLTRNAATQRIEKPSTLLRAGDSLAFSLNERVRIVEILALARRRGPASEAALLYHDASPPPPSRAESALRREKGTGRPTKKERRALTALKSSADPY